MRINEVVSKVGIPVTDYVWDEGRVGFATTVDGKEIQFFPAKSKWDRGAANDAAKKLAVRTRSEYIAADQARREHEYQYNKPLTELEKRWVEMTNRFMSLTPEELERWKSYGAAVRKSLLDGSHPAVKK